ncbi:MAG: hypothetical protein JO060_03235 [Candidatus Eremiobacteraeota bacterium]|nr:hypothetical protein [Candidatus Eremiobacteraeota bacterium]
MKFYDFVDKDPPLPTLIIIEGTEPVFADLAVERIAERLLDVATRDLNLDRFIAPELESMDRVAAACAAMPFLGPARLIVVRQAENLRAAERRILWEIAQHVPTGNTLVIADLQPATKRTKPETFGQLAGRAALRVDTAPTPDARGRYVQEALRRLGASAQTAVVTAIAGSDAPLIAVQTDLEKLALLGTRITLEDVIRESIVAEDVRGYQAAGALVEGDVSRALALTHEMIASSGERGAAVPLLAAIASEYRLVWELARQGGELPARFRWRERALRPIARRLGQHGARLGYERAVRGFESIVTGKGEDLRTIVAVLATQAAKSRERRTSKTSA